MNFWNIIAMAPTVNEIRDAQIGLSISFPILAFSPACNGSNDPASTTMIIQMNLLMSHYLFW